MNSSSNVELQLLSQQVSDHLRSLSSLNRKSKLQSLKEHFPFIRCFPVKGVQGIAGILEFSYSPPTQAGSKTTKGKKGDKKASSAEVIKVPIVFKVNVDVNLSIEHERDVLMSLNQLRKWCPHFVGCLGSLSMPISSRFIESERQPSSDDESDEEFERRSSSPSSDSEEEIPTYEPGTLSLWDKTNTTTPSSLLFLEYIGNTNSLDTYSMHHLCRYGSMQQCLAQMVMTLSGLEIAQQELKFVHYDMHLDNILLQECDENLVCVYLFSNPNDAVIVPTLGHYPVMIDMGSSFCQSLVGTSVKTSISFYSSGLQPTVYDPLNDVHHFLFRCIDRLELFNEKWRDVGTKFMHIFRHLPLWRFKGWKQLPSDLVKRLVKTIYEVYPDMAENDFWNDYTYEIMDNLVISTSIHWKQDDGFESLEIVRQQLETAMRTFSKHLQVLDDYDDFEADDDILIIIREVANLSRKLNKTNNFILPREDEKKFRQHLLTLIESVPPKLNLMEFTHCVYRIGRIFSHLLAIYLKDNLDVIHNAYDKISLKRPYDAIKVLQKLVPFRYRICPETVFRVFDQTRRTTIDIPVSELVTTIPKNTQLTPRNKLEFLRLIRENLSSKTTKEDKKK